MLLAVSNGVLILPLKLTELDKKIYKYLVERNDEGIPQNVLWKELSLSSREVSRSLKKLEAMNLVRREPIIFNGRKTFRVVAIKKRVDDLLEDKERVLRPILSINGFLDIPCMACPYIFTICYEGGYYDPRSCPWLLEWVKSNVGRGRQSLREDLN